MEIRTGALLVAVVWRFLLGSAAAGRPSFFLEEMGIAEAPSRPEARTGATFVEASTKEQILLVVSKFQCIQHYVIFVSIHYLCKHRQLVNYQEYLFCESVVCNFGAAFMWAIYMNIQMYLSYGYAGIDAVVINCLTMAFNIIVLLMYFHNGKEYIKFVICLVISLGTASCFTGVLVFHPYSALLSRKTIKGLNYWSNFSAIFGMGFFGVLNILPFHDLWQISRGGGQGDIVTLCWPMLMCTFYNCFVSFLRTLYAWIFSSSDPNYFMIPNIIAAILSLIQTFWLGFVCLHYRKVEGHITDSESFRSSLFKLAKTLDRMASVPVESASWKGIGKFESFSEHVLLGKQSLSHINLALQQEMALLEAKIAAAADRQVELKDAATDTADNAGLIVAAATNAVSQSLESANATQLASQQASVLNARRHASNAVLRFLQKFGHGQGIEEIPAVAEANDGGGNPQNQGPDQGNQARRTLTLSRELQRFSNIVDEVSTLRAADVANSAAIESDARAAMLLCSDLSQACNLGVNAFHAISTAVNNQIADTQVPEFQALRARAVDAHALQQFRILALRSAIRDASPHIKVLANRVRSSLQVVNATTGIPVTLREALRQSQEEILVLKTTADSLFFGTRAKLRRLICKC